jgi:hypothetical protein
VRSEWRCQLGIGDANLMGYPKHMYKGSYTSAKLNAEEKIVADEKQEALARKKGFIDGKEFFSKPATDIEID